LSQKKIFAKDPDYVLEDDAEQERSGFCQESITQKTSRPFKSLPVVPSLLFCVSNSGHNASF
jgi:hypothetical protein